MSQTDGLCVFVKTSRCVTFCGRCISSSALWVSRSAKCGQWTGTSPVCAEGNSVIRVLLLVITAAAGSVSCLLGCDAVLLGEQLPTLLRNVSKIRRISGLLDPEHLGLVIFRNVGICTRNNTASHPRRPEPPLCHCESLKCRPASCHCHHHGARAQQPVPPVVAPPVTFRVLVATNSDNFPK